MNAAEIAEELFAVRSQLAGLKLREADLADRLAAEMTEDRLELEGVGVFERRRKADRKAWDHEGVYSALLRRLHKFGPGEEVDELTGEIRELDPMEAAFLLLKACANPTWRVTALRQQGLDPSEFCETTYSGYSIQFVGALDGAQ
jgi:hypothetical protein